MSPVKILMIDDDRELCQELSEILAEEDYAVSIAHDGIAGKDLAETVDYDILLLDLRLPGVNGLEILRSVKAKGGEKAVIVISGSPLESNLLKPGENGSAEEILGLADRVIHKPFNVSELLAAVRALAGR
jgi:DNA-binding response OmpR family regulator